MKVDGSEKLAALILSWSENLHTHCRRKPKLVDLDFISATVH